MPSKIICAVRDRAIDAYMQPIFCQAIGQAIRIFIDEVNRKESPMNSHPEDYDLYHIGEYDEDTGHLSAISPRQIAIGKDVFKGDQESPF